MAVHAADVATLTRSLIEVVTHMAQHCGGPESVSGMLSTLRMIEPPSLATAGAPGAFTPVESLPANLAAMTGVPAAPETAWTEGQHVVLRDASKAYWDGNAWAAGEAPAP